MKKKHRSLIVLSLTCAIAFAGCSGGGSSSSSTPTPSSNTPASNNNESQNTSDSTTKLTIWGMGEEAKSLPKIAEDFTEANGITVDVQAIPWDQANEKLLTAVASKSGPDVVQMGTSWMPQFSNANALLDITDQIDKYPEFSPSNFFAGSFETTKVNDKIYGIPWYADTRFLYYRTDLLADAGYTEAPKTWEELKEMAHALAQRGAGKYGFAVDVKEQSLAFMFARQNGSTLFDSDGNPLFNEKEFVETVEYLNSFIKDGDSPLDLQIDAVQGFKDDAIQPMFISGPWMVGIINESAPELEGKWATAVLPAKENNKSMLGGSNLSVFQHSSNADAALQFIAYMSQSDTQIKWKDLTNALPANIESWEDDSLKNDPLISVIGEQLANAEPMPTIPQFEALAQTFLSDFETIYRTDADVQTVMDQFNEKAKTLLNK